MIQLPTPAQFRTWQISHYTQRLAAARTTQEKAFIRGQLYNFKKAGGDHGKK